MHLFLCQIFGAIKDMLKDMSQYSSFVIRGNLSTYLEVIFHSPFSFKTIFLYLSPFLLEHMKSYLILIENNRGVLVIFVIVASLYHLKKITDKKTICRMTTLNTI